MKREEIIKEKGYWTAKIQIDIYKQLEEFIKKNDLNRTQLAKRLGVTKGYISQIMNGDFDHRLSKFVDLALAIGKVPKIEFEDIEQVINDEKNGFITIKWKMFINPNM